MSTETKQRANIFAVLKNMFSSEPDIEDYDDIELPSELKNTLKGLKTQEENVEKAINVETRKSSKNGGFTKKIDPKTEQAMRIMHNQVTDKNHSDKEKEIGDE